MVLIAIDKLNRRILGYTCRNGNILAYCCAECDVEFEVANQFVEHMSKHHLRPQEEEEEPQEHAAAVEAEKEGEDDDQRQLQSNEEVPNKNECMEADTTNGTNSEIDIPLTQEEIENRLRSEYNLKQCSIPLFRFSYDIDDFKSDSDDTSIQSRSSSDDDEKSLGSRKTLRKRIKAPSPLVGTADPRKLFECEHCSMTFAHGGQFRRHYNSAHPVEKPFVCCLCGKKFVTNDELTDHQQHHQPDSTKAPVFPCPTCGKNVQNLKRHLRDHELETAYEIAMSTGDDMVTESIDDGIKQENPDSFDVNGLQTIGLEVEYIVTSDSEFNVSTTSNIQNGCDSIDMDIKPPGTQIVSKFKRKSEGNVFWCTRCPKRFKLEILLNQHLRNHDRPRVPCPVCGKQITKNYKRAHLLKFHQPTIDNDAQTNEQHIDVEYILEVI